LWCSIDQTSSFPCFAGRSHRRTAICYLSRRIPSLRHQILSRPAHPIGALHRSNKLIPLFCRHLPSPHHHLLSWPAHPIAAPPNLISAGASHRRAPSNERAHPLILSRPFHREPLFLAVRLCASLPLAMTLLILSSRTIFHFCRSLRRNPISLSQRSHQSCRELSSIFFGRLIASHTLSCNDATILVIASHHQFLSQPSLQFNLPLAASIPLSLQATNSFSPKPFSLAGNHHIHLWCGQSSSRDNAANLVVVSHLQFSTWPLAQFYCTRATI
jgi:hypothetical protein